MAAHVRFEADFGGATDAFDVLVITVLALLIALAPLPLGAVAPWALGLVFCATALAALLWLLHALRRGRIEIVRGLFWLPVLGFLALVAFQVAPLAPETLGRLSPAALSAWRQVLPGAPRPVSLFPYGTWIALLRVCALFLVFVVVLHAVRKRWQAVALLAALIVAGSFEAVYGIGEQFSGHRHIFWQARTEHLTAVTGTFLNKNHFAGLMGMVLPATLGLLLGTLPRHRGTGNARTRILAALSSPRHHLSLLLAAAIVILAVAACFSLSRAGLLSIVLTFSAFAACVGLTARSRRLTAMLLALAACIVLTVAAIGTKAVLERMEDAAHGRAASWADRLDLSRSGVAMVREFPLVGTGLGSFRYSFERFQSPRFGDHVADFLHNDWLQAACETGLIGAVLLALLAAMLVWTTLRKALARQDPFCRWVAVGACLGAANMLLHSLFDYNLSKITANAVIFTMLCALAYAVAHMPSDSVDSPEQRRFWSIRLGPPPVRALLGLAALGGVVVLCIKPVRVAQANIAFNRFLADSGSSVDEYFFLPMAAGPLRDTAAPLQRAQRLDPENPEFYYAAARFEIQQAHELSLRTARKVARDLMAAKGADDEAAIEKAAQAMAVDFDRQPSSERAEHFVRAEAHIRRALERLPVAAKLHLCLAQTLTARLEAAPDQETPALSEEIEREIAASATLAPAKPGILCAVGRLRLAEAIRVPARRDERLQQAQAAFRAAIAADPRYANEIYALLQQTLRAPSALIEATPRTFRAYRELATTLWNHRDWKDLLTCLDILDTLCEQQITTDNVSPWTLQPQTTARTDGEGRVLDLDGARMDRVPTPRQVIERQLYVAHLRAATQGILGRWEEREATVRRYRQFRRAWFEPVVQEARERLARRQYDGALESCRAVLDQDWSNPEALLTAAEAAAALGMRSLPPRWDGALDHLFRLVLFHEGWTTSQLARAQAVIAVCKPQTATDSIVTRFICGAGAVLAGRPAEGIALLEPLADPKNEDALLWRQRHLILYFIGRAREASGDATRAIAAYAAALAIVPRHGPSLERMRALDPTAPAVVPEAQDQQCHITFGGRLSLRGYSLRQESVPSANGPRPKWFITYQWQFHERLDTAYAASVQFCDANGGIVLRAGHRIQDNGKPYPSDLPRCGEMVVEKQLLGEGLGDAQFIRFSLEPTYGKTRARGVSAQFSDSGGIFAYACLGQQMTDDDQRVSERR